MNTPVLLLTLQPSALPRIEKRRPCPLGIGLGNVSAVIRVVLCAGTGPRRGRGGVGGIVAGVAAA